MKRIYFLSFFLVLLIASCNRSGNEDTNEIEAIDSIVDSIVPTTVEEVLGISEVITRFVRAYASKDNEKANQLIHPDLGLYVIYRPGVADTFEKVDSIDFAAPVPDWYKYPDINNEHALTFGKLPVFSCDSFTWNKKGFVCDTTARPTQLLQIAEFENEFVEGAFSAAELRALSNKSKSSFRVIVTTENPLIFHVQHYEGKWYVTVLDRAYGSCEA